MHEGIRTKQYSLEECINCHVSHAPDAAAGQQRATLLQQLPHLRGGQHRLLRVPCGPARRDIGETVHDPDTRRPPACKRMKIPLPCQPGITRSWQPRASTMTDNAQTDTTRRRFLGGAATAAAGLALAPGVLLHEVAQARPADEPVSSAVRWGMLIDTNKCAKGCTDCVDCLRQGTRPAPEHGRPADRCAMDPQGRSARQADRLYPDPAPALPALRAPAMRGRLPHRRVLQARRRHRAGGQAHLYRMPLLHDGLPLQGALLRARDALMTSCRIHRAARVPWRAAPSACTGSIRGAHRPVSKPARRKITTP